MYNLCMYNSVEEISDHIMYILILPLIVRHHLFHESEFKHKKRIGKSTNNRKKITHYSRIPTLY